MPVQELDVSGRGLFLVDKLSDRWGVDLLPRGKTTWFEMRVAAQPEGAPSAACGERPLRPGHLLK